MYDVGSLIDSIYGTETRAPYLGTTNSYGYTVSNFLNILYAGEDGVLCNGRQPR